MNKGIYVVEVQGLRDRDRSDVDGLEYNILSHHRHADEARVALREWALRDPTCFNHRGRIYMYRPDCEVPSQGPGEVRPIDGK